MLSIVSSQKLDWTHTFDTHCTSCIKAFIYLRAVYIFPFTFCHKGRVTTSTYIPITVALNIPCLLSLWVKTGIPHENLRLSADY